VLALAPVLLRLVFRAAARAFASTLPRSLLADLSKGMAAADGEPTLLPPAFEEAEGITTAVVGRTSGALVAEGAAAEKSFHLRQPSKSIRACMQPHSTTLRSSQTKLTG
jgi:hypothetical protein